MTITLALIIAGFLWSVIALWGNRIERRLDMIERRLMSRDELAEVNARDMVKFEERQVRKKAWQRRRREACIIVAIVAAFIAIVSWSSWWPEQWR